MKKREVKNGLEHVVEDFHQCTQLVIVGFNHKGEILCSRGTTDEGTRVLARSFSCLQRDCVGVSTTHFPKWGQFFFLATCEKLKKRGYFLIGPFSKETGGSTPRSPALFPLLLRLLQFIQERDSFPCSTHETQSIGCLHVQRALNYIQAHYNKPLTLQEMAHRLKLSKSYLSHRFHSEVGVTFCQWINRVRIEKSKELLLQTEDPIAAIAMEVGYASQSYYTAMFTKILGITPKVFRKQGHLARENQDN